MDPSGRLMRLDELHHGAWVVIITAICLGLMALCFLIRMYVRKAHRVIAGLPDLVFSLAGFVGVAQACLVFWEVDEGLGTSMELLDDRHVERLHKSFFASNVLYLAGIYLSKCCISVVYLQLTPNVAHHRASYALLGICTLWLMASILALGTNCELNRPWSDLASHCPDIIMRWKTITAFDILIEIALFTMAAYIVYELDISTKTKFLAMVAFGLRGLVVIPTIFRLQYLSRQVQSTDPTLSAAETVIWTSVQLHLSISSCASYCFKSFVVAVSTNYGGVMINVDAYHNKEIASGQRRRNYGIANNVEKVGSTATCEQNHE